MAVTGQLSSASRPSQISAARPGGPVTGLLESLCLVFQVPGFGRLAFFTFLMGGNFVSWVYVLPPLEQVVWKEQAASNSSWMNMGRALLSLLFVGHFGQWSDKHGRRHLGLLVMLIATYSIGLPQLILGSTETSLWISFALVVASGPLASHLSGCPVLWAFAADILPPEHRETGFGIIMAASSLGAFALLFGAKLVGDALPQFAQANLWFCFGCFLAAVLVWISLRGFVAKGDEGDDDEPVGGGACAMVTSPFRLLWKRATLRAIGAVALFLTFADMAASDVSSQILYRMLGIYEGTVKEMQDANLYYTSLPNPALFVVSVLVGSVSRRFGPHNFLMVWIPTTAVLFAAPALLEIEALHANWAITLAGFFALLPLTNYGPLQSLVVHVVPARRIGEAMGAIATCKNLASLAAPLVMGSVTEALAATGNNDKLWIIYPLCAGVMLCGWPFTCCLARRAPRETNMTWSAWTSRPSIFQRSSSAAPLAA